MTPVQKAWAFFVQCRQSLAGRMKSFTGITKTRTRRGMNVEVSAWLTAVEGLPAVHERLKRVLILNRPALDVIRGQDGAETLFYCDPPYLHETRATTADYQHEMTWAEHVELLRVLAKLKGRFLLSGYRSDLYNSHASLNGWNRHDFELPNQAASGKTKRRMTECVWANF
jgi:DNA adenine methylase